MMRINRNSIWEFHKKGRDPRLASVVAIWAVGAQDKYKIVAYELKDAESGQIATIDYNRMIELIESGRAIRKF